MTNNQKYSIFLSIWENTMKKFVLSITLTFFLAMGVFAQQKYALVIGNGTYTNFGTLKNAVNDANDMAEVLQGLGFTVDKLINANLTQMENAAIKLRDRLSSTENNAYGFFYYAGHGVQVDGVNYLIPANANIPDKDFLRERAISAQSILDMLNRAKNSLNIVVLDACRDFPAAWSRSADRGLAVMHPPTDSIIMYSTAAGRTASDGTGRNGLFTSYLLQHLKTPGIEVNDVFRRTMSDVARASNNEQRPAMYTDFADIAYLGSKPQASATTQTAQPQQAVTQPIVTQPTTTAQTAQTQQTASIPTNMVYIQGGTFMMGSPIIEPSHDNDEIQHQVTVSSFFMGKYEVTQKEYQEVMGINPSNFKGDNFPVENVSWYDAIEYCNKRSQKEGLTPVYTRGTNNVIWNKNANGYRLPTEAEWEYACRAGTISAYNTGESINDNTGWYSKNSDNKIHPVGQKSANRLGLYDIHGNVWEWCWDFYGNYSNEAQTDPLGISSGSNRIKRGGSWSDSAVYVRSAYRGGNDPYFGLNNLGFRLVRNF